MTYTTGVPEYLQQPLRQALTPQFGSQETGAGGFGGASGGFGGALGRAGIGAGLGGLLGGLFGGGGGQSTMGAANPYFQQALQQMYGMQKQLPGYFQPYTQAGMQAVPQLEQQYGALTSDPTALMSKIGSTYQASPGYHYQVQQALQAANQAAAAGGMAGSPAEQAGVANRVSGIAKQDYGDYMSRALGLYRTGLSGMGNLAGMGLQGATGLAQGEMGAGANIANILGSQAQLAAAQAQSEQQQKSQEASGIGGLFGGIAGAALPFIL